MVVDNFIIAHCNFDIQKLGVEVYLYSINFAKYVVFTMRRYV